MSCPFFAFHSAFAADPGVAGSDFQNALERIQKAGGRTGVQLVSLPSGQVICDYQSKETFVPASLVKLLTSYSALKKLGPSFRFQTGVYALNEPVDGVDCGGYLDKGQRRPPFCFGKSATARPGAQRTRDKGNPGRVLVDSSFFQPASERICLDGDCTGSYNPVVSAAAIDFNMVTLRLSIPPKTGKSITVDSLPAGNYAHVSGGASTGKKGGNP